MVSVTSEVLANVSFQGATARSARSDSDQSAGNDSFAALVDNNTAAGTADNRAQDTSGAPRRADDSQGPDNRSRDNAASSDKAASDKATSDRASSDKAERTDARKDSDNRDAAVTARNDSDADAKGEATHRSKSKSASSKSEAKSDEGKTESKTSAADIVPATDQTQVKQDATAVITAGAIATVIPVTTAAAETTAAAATSTKATAPLAIAAAAIAATAALTGTAAAPAATDAAATPAATANAAKTSGAKIDAHAAVGEAITAPVVSAVAGVTADVALAASAAAAAATPGASKAAPQVKTPVVAKEGTAVSGEQDSTAGTTIAAPASTPDTIVPAVTPQAEVAGKAKPETGIVDAAKAEIAGHSASAPSTAAAGGHAATADASQSLTNAADNSLQAAGAIQTQQPANASTAAAAAPQLNVTAATAQAAVPLSGLAMEIAASAKSGKSRFEIRLDPADLGRIDVRIDVDRNGQVTSHLTVERPETLSMLRQDANQLQRALDNAGLSTGNSGLQFSLRDQSSQGQNDNSGSNPNAHRLIVSEDDTIPAAVAGRSYGRMLGSSSGVDIRV